MTELLYLAPNERYDTLMADLRRLGIDSLSKVNSGDILTLRKLIHLADLPLLAQYARERLTTRSSWD